MATTTLGGNPVQTNSDLPATGSAAPDFLLIGTDLSEKTLADFAGKKKILTINPSYDTSVCQTAARTFNERAANLADVVVLVISADLPFAQKRFCVAEGLEDRRGEDSNESAQLLVGAVANESAPQAWGPIGPGGFPD